MPKPRRDWVLLVLVGVLLLAAGGSLWQTYLRPSVARAGDSLELEPRYGIKIARRCPYCGRYIRAGLQQAMARRRPPDSPDHRACSSSNCRQAARMRAEHPDWSRRDCYAIIRAKVRVGMSPEQARLAWGEPDEIIRGPTMEQWLYPSVFAREVRVLVFDTTAGDGPCLLDTRSELLP